jgi:hypothetical protein
MTTRNDSPDSTPDKPGDGRRKPGRPRRTEPGIEQYEAIKLDFAGKTKREIAQHLGVSEKTISRWLGAPDVKREVGKHLEDISTKLWAKIAEEGEATLDDLVQSMHGGDPRIELRARTWLLERLLEITPMSRLIAEGLLAEDAVPPALQPPSDPNEEGDAA